jgi:hypothetical protein
MKRLILAGTIILAAMALHLQPAQARPESPWCAVSNLGLGGVYWDCRFNSVEECTPWVIAGNRGFCNRNPRWEGWYAPQGKPVRHAKRHNRHVKPD